VAAAAPVPEARRAVGQPGETPDRAGIANKGDAGQKRRGGGEERERNRGRRADLLLARIGIDQPNDALLRPPGSGGEQHVATEGALPDINASEHQDNRAAAPAGDVVDGGPPGIGDGVFQHRRSC
jgi:hypothetical protein